MLCSYILKFNFKTDAGHLDYLSEKSFKLDTNSLKDFFRS